MKKMNMKTIINWLYATVIDRAKTERRPRENREKNFSLYRPVSVPYAARISLVSLFLLVLGGWSSEVWGNTTSYDGSQLNTNGTWGLNHGSFTISGGSFNDNEWNLCELNKSNTSTFNISWGANSGSSIKITNITFAMLGYGTGSQVKAKFNNNSYTNIGNLAGGTTDVSIDNPSSGLTLTVFCSANIARGIRIKKITITYTITPNAPGVVSSTETVNVTLDANNLTQNSPQTVSLDSHFSFADHYGESKNYSITTNPNDGGVISGSTFYATKAGIYKVKAGISAKDGCHAASAQSGELTITVNRLTPTLTYGNGAVDVSLNSTDKTTLDLSTLKTAYSGNGTISYSIKSGTGGNISGNTFYATQTGNFVITATASQTDQYASKTCDFTVTVNKRTPTFVWRTFSHIYSGAVLENLAQAQYNGANVGGLSYTYSSNNTTAAVVDGTTVRVPTTGFTTNQDVRISVKTAETDYYLAGSSYHDYLIEPKKSPVFKLNGNVIADGATAMIDLLIGQTATVSFENIDNTEATFHKPNNPSFVTYAHNSSTHTGVITATAFGTTNLTFSQAGNDTIFGHTGYVTVNVKKHPVELATTLNGITCEVEDSVATEGVYSIETSPVDGQPFADVTIVSDNEEVVRFVEGKWRAKNAGNATLSIRMPTNAYWTGDTITAAITVRKKTPVFTWMLPATSNFNREYIQPVISTNNDKGCTISYVISNSAIRYENGKLNTYEIAAQNVSIQVTQAGNYKWKEHSETYYVNVEKLPNHLPLTINTQAIYNAVNGGTQGDVGFQDGNVIRLGGSDRDIFHGPAYNKDDKYIDIAFEGIPSQISFSYAVNQDAATSEYWYIKQKAHKNDEWSDEIWHTEKEGENFENVTISSDKLSKDTRYIRLCYSGNFAGLFKNVTITERKELTAPASVDMGSSYVGNAATERTINVDWCNVKSCTVTLSGTNAGCFELLDNSIASTLDNYGTAGIRVKYKHEVAGSHTATLTITSADSPAKTATITLNGVTQKAIQSIIWRDDITPLPLDEPYSGAATATSGLEVQLVAETPGILAIEGDQITGIGVGTTRLFASQAGDDKWAAVNETISVEVTNKHVQHIIWTDKLSNVKREGGKTVTINLTAISDADASLPITYTLDDDASTFASVSGNTLSVTNWGQGYITARQAGNEDYVGVSKTVKLLSRDPNAACDPLVLDEAGEKTLHTIDSEEFELNGEPSEMRFEAKCDGVATWGLWIGQKVNGQWSEAKYYNRSDLGTSYKKYSVQLDEHATHVKIYTETGATLTRTFKKLEVSTAKYLRLKENNMDFSNVNRGQILEQTFSVNYSNISEPLEVTLANASEQFTIITETIGEDCGDINHNAQVRVRFTGRTLGEENNTIILSNKDQRLEIPVSATVVMQTQTITWNVASTVNVNTTDEVALSATATSGLAVSFRSSDDETAEAYQKGDGTWALRIHKAGTITVTASQDGNAVYGGTETARTYNISRVTPEITVIPTAETVSVPATLADVDLTDGEASVAGTFTWQTPATSVDRFNSGYTVLFTPENTNWYNTTTCNVLVPVNKDAQTITWNFSETEIYCDADITFDASASSRLAVRYTSSNASIAYVDEDNKLKIVCGGEVTITAQQDGNETFSAATPVAKVLTIKKFTPEVTAPTAAAIKKGKLLDNATLSGGAATSNGNEVEGIFTWENGSEAMNTAGTFSRTVVFTPSNTNYYNVVRMDVEVEVQKFSPAIEHTLTASAITYGAALSTSELSGTLTATDTVKVPSVGVAGTYAWLNGEAILDAGNPTSATVRFTPTESDQYNAVDFEVSIVVNQAAPVLSVTASDIASYQTLSQSVLTNDGTPGVCTWDAALDATTAKYTAGDHVLAYTFTPNSANYLSASGTATVHVEKGCVLTNNAEGGWNLASNWENNAQPDEDTHVLVQTNIEISHEIAAKSLDIDEGATVTIAPTGGLTIGDGGITNATKENLILKAKLEDDGDGERGQTAYIRFSPDYEGEMPEATIELFSVGYKDVLGDSGDDYWQYVGVPVAVEGYAAKTAFPKSMVESWHEDQGKWVNDRKNLILKPFVGYATSQYRNAEGFKMTFNGPLVQNRGTVEIDLDYTSGAEHNLKGWNMVANSFAAPIDITRLTVEDFNGADATIYLWDAREDSYIEIPVATLGSLPSSVQRVIPSMQAFFVHTDAATTLTLDYERLVWEGTQDNKPLKVQQKAVNESLTGRMSITMIDAFGKDELHLLESDSYDKSYENGYDAPKKAVEGRSAIYAIEDRELAVDATDDMRGTKIGIRAGEIDTCQLVFSHVESDHVLYFVDNLTGDKYLIEEGKAISLEFIDMEVEGRFEIVGSQDDHGVSTGVESAKSDKKVTKYIKDNTVYILKNGLKYNSLGQRVQ